MLYLEAYDCHGVHDVIDVSEHAGHGGDGVTDVTGFQRVKRAFLQLLSQVNTGCGRERSRICTSCYMQQHLVTCTCTVAQPATCYSNVKISSF